MALIIEDGTGVANANAMSSAADCVTFATEYYGSSLTGSTAEREATILRVINYMMSLPWHGELTYGNTQLTPYPRTGVTGYAATDMPWQVIKAQHILARAEHKAVGTLAPSGKVADQRKKVKVDVIEVEYVDTDASIDAQRTTVTDAMDLLAPFLIGGASGSTAFAGGWY